MEQTRRTLLAGIRIFRTNPGVAAFATIALAMGIGFTATMFAIVRGASRPLPVAEADRVVAIRKIDRSTGTEIATGTTDLRAWRGAAALSGLAAFQTVSANLGGDGRAPERVAGAAISTDAFAILGVRPAAGRAFDSGSGGRDEVILSDRLWKRRYAADAGILGSTLRIDGRAHSVVGVMPSGMGFPIRSELWTALTDSPAPDLGAQPATLFGRLAPGVSIDRARAELAAAASGTAQTSIEILPFTEIETPRAIIRGLQLLVVAVSLVLLIACGNVASLLVVRGAARAREIATRVALGASRKQLVAEQLAETAALSIVAAGLGLWIARVAVRAFSTGTANIIEAYWVDFRVDAIVVLFASLLAAIAAAAAGLGPALRISSINAIDVLKDRSHGSTGAAMGRLARVLPAAQIAMACGLLALTVLLGRAAVEMRTRPWPFDASNILSAQYGIPLDVLADAGRRNRLMTALDAGLRQAPGIDAAGLVSALPGRGAGEWSISIDRPHGGGQRADGTTAVAFATPGFFDVVGARVLAGRALTWRDDAAAPRVAVVNESFVRRYSPDRSPIGRRVFLGARDLTIVGVVADLMARDLDDARADGIYGSILQQRPYAVRVVARAAGGPVTAANALTRETARIDPDLPVFEIFTLREAALRDKAVLEVLSALFLLFGGGALLLTAVGLYGVVSFTVAQRTREFGIRLALGATRMQVAVMVGAQGARQIGIGAAIGLMIAGALTAGFSAAIESAPRSDVQVFAVIAGAVALTAAAAMLRPAWRAVSIEIAAALRQS